MNLKLLRRTKDIEGVRNGKEEDDNHYEQQEQSYGKKQEVSSIF